ncbi:mannonate dehydratase [Candidatus Thiomargarita nelsonii]|uniref:Mannonate dehydratase n=1 Tax=Candidatus Thiomargarita nelsonii TaxID=1003181 RepID=A0A0A6NZ63_9GAMM|nr:mannonate dehydratase [Candidatus Thiomargarita nelsonii]
MQRRYFLGLLGGLAGLSAYSFKAYWPDDNSFFNDCLDSMPDELANHEVVLSAFEGLDTSQIWDGHVHLLGLGDSDSGIWINPQSLSILSINHYIRFRFFLNASCPLPNMSVDEGYVARLKSLHWGRGSRFILLAFDHSYNEQGEPLPDKSAFYVPNRYAAQVHKQSPDTFEWLASIHPYRKDCVEALEEAFLNGARGVKWLPPAMGMNPASPLCDRFYKAMVSWDIPLLCHCGDEHAVSGTNTQTYGNPLALRRALDQGVKVVIAHCGSLGSNRDTDKGPNGAHVSNFELFARLMDEERYNKLLFADISALTQNNRIGPILDTVITRSDWHPRLLYASDYPLPGVMPLTSLSLLHEKQYITAEQLEVLAQLRQYNSLLFDFVLKRLIQVRGQGFATSIFQTRSLWTGAKA